MLQGNLSGKADEKIAASVAAAEQRTSAEIKIVILRYCWRDLREKARLLFHKHNLHRTRDRNAVMILLVLVNREFLVYGDSGIHEKVPDNFWLTVRDAMQEEFQAGKLVEGLCVGIARVGAELATHFPRSDSDVNEISDTVIHEN
jgi:uncharacterized membrane protein